MSPLDSQGCSSDTILSATGARECKYEIPTAIKGLYKATHSTQIRTSTMVYPHSLVHWGPVCIWKPNLLSVLGDHSNRRCEGQSSHHLSTAMKKMIEIMLHITLLPTVPLTPLRTHKRIHVLLTPLQQSFSLGLQSYLCTRW